MNKAQKPSIHHASALAYTAPLVWPCAHYVRHNSRECRDLGMWRIINLRICLAVILIVVNLITLTILIITIIVIQEISSAPKMSDPIQGLQRSPNSS